MSALLLHVYYVVVDLGRSRLGASITSGRDRSGDWLIFVGLIGIEWVFFSIRVVPETVILVVPALASLAGQLSTITWRRT